jgi:hypothetical protein
MLSRLAVPLLLPFAGVRSPWMAFQMKKTVRKIFKHRTCKFVSFSLIFTLHMAHSIVSSFTNSDEKANPSKEGDAKPWV